MVKRRVAMMVMLGVIVVLSLILTAGAYYRDVTIAPDVTLGAQRTTLVDGYKARIVLAIRSGSVVALSYLALRTGSAPDGGGIQNSGVLEVTGAMATGNATSYGGRCGAPSNSGALTVGSSTFRDSLSFGIHTFPAYVRKPIDHVERLRIRTQAFVHYRLTFTTERLLP